MKLPFPHFSSLSISHIIKARSLNVEKDLSLDIIEDLTSEGKDHFLSSEGTEDGEDIGHGIKEGEVFSSIS